MLANVWLGARERRTLIDISEVAKASVRLINKKRTVYESCQKSGFMAQN
jgi:hypothetical protein